MLYKLAKVLYMGNVWLVVKDWLVTANDYDLPTGVHRYTHLNEPRT
jgi:hypothetical protein